MPSLGGWEFVILIGILVLLFGAKRLPDMARSIGQSARVFKGEMKGMKGDEVTPDKPATAPAPPAALPPTQELPQTPDVPQAPSRAAQQGHGSTGQ